MKLLRYFLLIFLIAPCLRGADLGDVVARLEDPKIENAKLALKDLDQMIADGDARTVTLAKKVHRSIKRIFTKEHKMHEGKKEADERAAKAKQFDNNGRKWLKPNIHGRVNKLAASAAFRDAKVLRQKSVWSQEEHSKEWKEEVLDYEKLLDELNFSKEERALVGMADLLVTIVERTSWVDQPELAYDRARIRFIKERLAGKDRWVTLASHAFDAGDLELAYDFYRRAGSELGRFRAGAKMAGQFVDDGYPGSAINLWERLGEDERARELGAANPVLTAASFRTLGSAALKRNVAPACVRVITPSGHQSGFFFRQGGFLMTSKDGILDKDGNPYPLKVILEDGRKLPAIVLGFSDEHDIAALKIEHKGHEVLPVADRVDLKAGLPVILFGFADPSGNLPAAIPGTMLAAMEEWEKQPISRLALDGSKGLRGAPVVDRRGRVAGFYLMSKTGIARSLEAGAIRKFLKQL